MLLCGQCVRKETKRCSDGRSAAQQRPRRHIPVVRGRSPLARPRLSLGPHARPRRGPAAPDPDVPARARRALPARPVGVQLRPAAPAAVVALPTGLAVDRRGRARRAVSAGGAGSRLAGAGGAEEALLAGDGRGRAAGAVGAGRAARGDGAAGNRDVLSGGDGPGRRAFAVGEEGSAVLDSAAVEAGPVGAVPHPAAVHARQVDAVGHARAVAARRVVAAAARQHLGRPVGHARAVAARRVVAAAARLEVARLGGVAGGQGEGQLPRRVEVVVAETAEGLGQVLAVRRVGNLRRRPESCLGVRCNGGA